MVFVKDLYLGETIAPKVNQIIEKMNNNQIVPNLYLIAMASNPENMLDLIPQWEALQEKYPKKNLRVVGLASGKKEAIGLVQYIVEESIEKTGSADVRIFLNPKWEGQA